MAEAELINKYGPAFAESYKYEDRVRVAKVLETIRKLHSRGNTLWIQSNITFSVDAWQ